MQSKEKPYVLFVAEVIYLKICEIKNKNPNFSNIDAIENFIGSKIYNEIKVTGNKRLSIETILIFSGLKSNTEIESKDLNQAIKNLYDTNYFKDIEIISSNNALEIKIIENPIIQSILIEGIKNKGLLKQILEITKKSEKYPFLNNRIKDQKNLLLNIVRANGFYFSEIETKIIDNNNNTSVYILTSSQFQTAHNHQKSMMNDSFSFLTLLNSLFN